MLKRSVLKVSAFLMLILSISLIFVACGKVEFKIDFIVDDAVYATINTKGEEVLKMPNDPEKDGYMFDGWYWDDSSWEKPFTANSLLDAPLSSNMSVYAKFVKNEIKGVSFENVEATYDGTEKEISVRNLPDGATVSYDKPNTYTDAGEYTVTATIRQANHFDLVLTATLKINKAIYDMSSVVFTNNAAIYNGQSHSVCATNLPKGVTVSYENNGKVNAGTYTVIAKFTGDNKNFEVIPDMSAILTIEKATVEKPVADTSTFVYNGKEQTYNIVVKDLYSVKGNKQINAGNYTVEISLKDNANYQWTDKTTDNLFYDFCIQKAIYDISNVTFENKTVTYSGEKQSVNANNLPTGVTVSYENNEKVNAGTYTVIAKFTGDNKNFEVIPDMSATLTIEKATVEKPVADTSTFVYNGKEQTYNIAVKDLYSVKGNKQTNAGNYTVEISLKDNANYQWTDKTTDNLFYGFCIQKAVYDMSGVIFESKTVTYDSKIHSIYATNLPKGVTVSYENNENINTGSYTVIAKFTGDNKNFEKIPDKTATLTILPDSFKGLLFESKVFIYDGTEKKIEVTGIPTGATVTYDKSNSQINAGKYTVKATVTKENYSDIVLIATLTINKATYNMSGVKFDNKTVVYSGEKYSILAQNIPDGLSVSYVGNDMINAGTYTVTAFFLDTTGNYENPQNKTATLTINKANVIGISFTDKTFVYDGDIHAATITGKLPSGVSVSYENNDKINVGTYTVTAIFNDNSGNFIVPANMTAKLIIEKATVLGITFDDKTFTYNGEKRNIEIGGILPEDIIVSYSNNGKVNAGIYTVIATFSCKTGNYFVPEDMTATLTIKKAVYDMSNVSFDDKTVTYDEKTHSLTISGILPNGVTVTYTNNDKVNADQYVVTASFTGDSINYFAIDDMQAMLIINKATYDMSAVSFTDGEFIYDGTQKAIYITGKLPDGVTVTYSNNCKIFANTYTVTAVFTGDAVNYNKIPDLSASLIINKATYDMSGISFIDESFKYDGNAHSIYIKGDLPADVSVSYKNNGQIEKGEWVVIAQFAGDENYNKIADIRATLTITREEHILTFKQDGQPDKICKVLDLADFTDIPSVTYVKGYKVVWEEKNYKRITADMEINAIITLETYTITYYLFDGENALKNPSVYTILDDIELKPAEKTGYTFNGWFTDGGFNRQIETISKQIGDITLYAKFTANQYVAIYKDGVTITLQMNGYKDIKYYLNYGETFDPYSYDVMSNYVTDEYNTYYGKESNFGGWYYNGNLIDASLTANDDIVLNGKFNNETASEALSMFSSDDQTSHDIKDPDLTSYGSKNYIFKVPSLCSGRIAVSYYLNLYGDRSYWGGVMSISGYVNGSYTSLYYKHVYSKERNSSLSGAIIITVDPGSIIRVYTESYNGGTISFSSSRRYSVISSNKKREIENKYDDLVKTPNVKDREGYSFAGWFDDNDVRIAKNWLYTEDKVFYPKWEVISYNINYQLNGGENNENNPKTYNVKSDFILGEPTKRGYTFNGWYVDDQFNEKIEKIFQTTGDITLYAKFTPNSYNLTIDSMGGQFAPKVTFISESSIIKTEYLYADEKLDKFYPENRNGYMFAGWYTDAEYNTVFNYDITITEDVVLYAKWVKNESVDTSINETVSSLSMLANGKIEQYIKFIPIANTSITITSVSGLDLIGTLYDGNKNSLIIADDIDDNNLNFSITFNVEAGKLYYIGIKGATVGTQGEFSVSVAWGGECCIKGVTYNSKTISITYDEVLNLPDMVEKEGYTFIGWFDEDNNKYESGVWNYLTDLTLHAVYKENNKTGE